MRRYLDEKDIPVEYGRWNEKSAQDYLNEAVSDKPPEPNQYSWEGEEWNDDALEAFRTLWE